jgi:hypothetical protein
MWNAGVEGAVVGHHVDAQAGDAAVFGGGDLAVHVVVAGEGGGADVLDAVLDPLDRPAQHDGGGDGAHVARVDAHLVAEAAADVGADDAHLALGDARQQRHHGAHHVRRLAGDVGGQFAAHRVEAGHAAAGLQRAGMHARVVQVLLDDHRCSRERGFGGGGVAGVPGEDVVVVVAFAVRALGLAGQVLAQHRGVGLQRLVGVDDDRQFLVLHLHRLHAVGGGVAILGDHDRHFLHLEVHLLVGQHRRHVASQRGHPVQLEGLQVIGRQHRQHARHLERLGLVDALDARVRVGAAHDVHVQHAGHLDVVDVVPLALDEARVLLAQAAVAQALQGGLSLGGVHAASLAVDCSLAAAYCTALTMFW